MRLTVETSARVLIADPIGENRLSLVETLSSSGISCVEAADGVSAWTRFTAERPDLVLAAIQLPGIPALELLTRVRDVSTTPFVMQVPAGQFAEAMSAIQSGVDDVIPFPCNANDLPDRIRAAIATNPARRSREGAQSAFIGRGPASSRIREQIAGLAGLRVSVLFSGEKGTGRDHAARCLAKADGIDPREWVRYSAEEDRRTRSDASRIVYVDEIESKSRSEQAYWAERILESERSVANAPLRVLISTSTNLKELARRNEIDGKLANILLRFVVYIPPLRDRSEDVIPIATSLIYRISQRIGRPKATISAPALRLLQELPWPGNVSQLAAVVERLVAFSPHGLITRRIVSSVVEESPASVMCLRQAAQRRQRDELVAILDETGGNLAEAARRMGMSRGAVIYRAQKFGLLAKRIPRRD